VTVVHDVDIVHVPEQAVAVLRRRSPLADIGTRMRHLRELVAGAGLTPGEPMTARFYDTPETAIPDYAVCLPVEPRADGSIPDDIGEARGELVPAHHALTTTLPGTLDDAGDAVRALYEALDALGYRANGPLTVVYESAPEPPAAPWLHVMELRVPYAR